MSSPRHNRPGGGVYAAARRLCARLLRAEDGSVITLVAMSAVTIMGLSAMAVDLSYATVLQSRLQSAADAAALAAAVTLPDQAAAVAEAQTYAGKNLAVSQNGAVLAANDVIFGNWDNATRVFAPNPPVDPVNAVEVRLRRADSNGNPVSTFFASIFGIETVDLSASAIAVANQGQLTCVLTLDPDSEDALLLDSNADVDIQDCAVHINSTDATALYVKSNSTLTADSVCIVGGYQDDSSGGISTAPNTNCRQQLDPLVDLPDPDTSGCDVTNYSLSSNNSDTLSPGIYCGGISVSSNADVAFDPGTYVIKDGAFNANSNATLAGTEVFFYLTGATSLIDFDSNSDVSFTAPNGGDYEGVLFFQDRDDGGVHRFDSNSSNSFTGVIYLPNALLRSASNTMLTSPTDCLMIVVGKAEFNSNAGLTTAPDPDICPFEVPEGLFLTGQLALRQ
jgi:Flp pilus assembly protein TadG